MTKLIIASLITLTSSLAWAGESIDKTLSIAENGKIFIENQRGKVKIIGWDQPQMQVKGELDDLAKGYKFESHGSTTIFQVKMPRSRHRKNAGGSDLEIYVPHNSKLDFEGVNVNVQASELKGGSSIETVNGQIKVQSLQGKVNLSTVNGEIISEHLQGKIHYETVNGNIEDANSSGRLRFDAVNGDIIANTKADDIRIENVNGEIELVTAKLQRLDISTVNGRINAEIPQLLDNARMQIETVSGSAELKFGKNTSAKFEVDSHAGGRIKNKLTNDEVKRAKYGPSSQLEFELLGGNADIEIDTISGRITLKSL